jgi:hypothetical protein
LTGQLRKLQTDHLLVGRKYLPAKYDDCAWFHAHFHLRYEDPQYLLFRVLP